MPTAAVVTIQARSTEWRCRWTQSSIFPGSDRKGEVRKTVVNIVDKDLDAHVVMANLFEGLNAQDEIVPPRESLGCEADDRISIESHFYGDDVHEAKVWEIVLE